jgi:ABC-type Na+ efflux pump permease subunit
MTARPMRGVVWAEFLMQVRRPAVWLVLLGLGVLSVTSLARVPFDVRARGADASVPEWAFLVQFVLPVGFGVLLADRYPRDRRLRVGELLRSAPASDTVRLCGKFLGAAAATLVPVALVYLVGLAWLVATYGDFVATALLALPAFVLVNLPGLLFVGAFSIACPIVLPVPLYQFLFVGYWFWGNILSPGDVPTLTDTWLTPIGGVAQVAFFPATLHRAEAHWSTVDGAASIALLLLLAGAALVAGLLVARWQQRED